MEGVCGPYSLGSFFMASCWHWGRNLSAGSLGLCLAVLDLCASSTSAQTYWHHHASKFRITPSGLDLRMLSDLGQASSAEVQKSASGPGSHPC